MSTTRGERRAVGVPGMLLVLGGAVLVLLSYRFLAWYHLPAGRADSVGDATFGELHANVDQVGNAGVASAYFDWLGWTLLIAVVVAGVAAGMPTRAADALRVAGFLLGLLGVASTYYALKQHSNATGGGGAFQHSTWGVWLTVTGFAAGAVGAALGPRSALRRSR